jgi:hypothetical protein
MRKLSLLFAFILTLLTMSSFGMGIKTDYDSDFNFGSLKTFAFQTPRRGVGDQLRTDTLEAKRIQDALTSQLETRNFQLAEGNPDFFVTYYARSKEKEVLGSFEYGFPHTWRWGWGGDLWTEDYTQGSLLMDIVDAKTNQLVWRGVVTDVLHKTPDQSQKQVDKAAEELVAHFVKDERKSA